MRGPAGEVADRHQHRGLSAQATGLHSGARGCMRLCLDSIARVMVGMCHLLAMCTARISVARERRRNGRGQRNGREARKHGTEQAV